MRPAAASLEDLTLSAHLSLLHNICILKLSGILFSCLTSLAADESQARKAGATNTFGAVDYG